MKRDPLSKLFILFVILVAIALEAPAQDASYPAKKPIPTRISPELFVFPDDVVTQQWAATLKLVNPPSDMNQVEPGQCVRFGVMASGDGREQLFASAKLGFELTILGHVLSFKAEAPEATKQIKPEGGDFVTQVLAAGGVKNPLLSMVSMAASRENWCAPIDSLNGTATIRANVTTPDGKNFALKARSIEVRTFESARIKAPFKDMDEVGRWLQHYHAAPDPANLLPAMRIAASNKRDSGDLNLMTFFAEALKASPAAETDLGLALTTETPAIEFYGILILSKVGYPIDALQSGISESQRNLIKSFHLPDPFDLTPDQTIGSRMDMLWSVFFATGRIEPVRAVASMLAWRADYDKFVEIKKSGKRPAELTESIMRGVAYTAAGWSLNALSRSDTLVADYIDALMSSPDTPSNVKVELANLSTNPAFTHGR